MITRNLFIEKMDKLIALLSAKSIKIVPGIRAETNGVDTIYMPWLPNNATEIDFIKFFVVACHEQAHFYGKTRVHLMSKVKIIHKLENVFDDIRCECLQEQEYPGLKYHRIKYYKIILDEFVNEELSNANQKDIGAFIRALGKYVIIKNRINQLETTELVPTPSDELIEAYNQYAADLEPRVMKMKTDSEAFELGHILYDRIKELIEKLEEEKLPPPPSPKDDKGEDKEEDNPEEKGDKDDSGTDEDDSETDDGRDGDACPSKELSEDGSGESDEHDDSTEQPRDDTSDDNTGGEPSSPSDEGVPEDGGEATESDDGSSSLEPEDDDEPLSEEERRKIIEEAVKRALEDADGEPIDLMTKVIEEINLNAENSDQYMVHPDVKDDINFNRVGDLYEAKGILNSGLKILGTSGSKMIQLFVSNSKPSYLHYQKSGRFDGMAYVSDPMDKRTNVYSIKTIPRIEKAAVSFMMDNSSSMSGQIEAAYSILSGITYHLSRGCVPVEAVGFTASLCNNPNYRDTPVQLRIIKAFNEPYSGDVIRRFVKPANLDQNAEVDCMRFMIPRLMARPEQKKVFCVIGDGKPFIGCEKLNKKLTKAYKEYIDLCRAAGIIVFGFGINCNLSWIFQNDFISVNSTNMGDRILSKLSEVLNRPRNIVGR